MTIQLFSGTPGSGKSLHAARKIVYALRYRKIPVIANFPVSNELVGFDNFQYVANDKLSPQCLIDFARSYWNSHHFKEDSILLVIDECQLLWNSREGLSKSDKAGRMAWLSFFSQHRKYGFEIILICQFDRMIDRQIRSMIEYEYLHRKMSVLGLKGRIFCLLAVGEVFVALRYYYPLHEHLSTEFFRYRKKFASIYDSYADFSGSSLPVGNGDTGAPTRGNEVLEKRRNSLQSRTISGLDFHKQVTAPLPRIRF